MSLINRLNRLVRANLNDLASRASGGGRVFREVRDSLREAKTQMVECRLTEKRLQAEYDSLLDQSYAWEDRAMLALRANDEELARRALGRKHDIDRRARAVKEQLDEQRAYLVDLDRSLEAIEVKLEALREGTDVAQRPAPQAAPREARRPAPSAARRDPEQARRLADLEAKAELGSLGEPELFGTFEEMSSRLSQAEAELEAYRELSGSHAPIEPTGEVSDDELERRFRELETNRDLKRLHRKADRLDDLRRRLDED